MTNLGHQSYHPPWLLTPQLSPETVMKKHLRADATGSPSSSLLREIRRDKFLPLYLVLNIFRHNFCKCLVFCITIDHAFIDYGAGRVAVFKFQFIEFDFTLKIPHLVCLCMHPTVAFLIHVAQAKNLKTV